MDNGPSDGGRPALNHPVHRIPAQFYAPRDRQRQFGPSVVSGGTPHGFDRQQQQQQPPPQPPFGEGIPSSSSSTQHRGSSSSTDHAHDNGSTTFVLNHPSSSFPVYGQAQARPRSHPAPSSPIDFNQALGILGTPYQAFAGDPSLNFLDDDFGYSSSGLYDYTVPIANEEVAAAGFAVLPSADLLRTDPPTISTGSTTNEHSNAPSPLRAESNRAHSARESPSRSNPPHPPPPPIHISSPDHSRPTSPRSAPITIDDSHTTDSGVYRPGDIEVEAPLKQSEGGKRPEIGLDSFRWAIQSSLSRNRGEGAFPRAYIPPKDLPEWHKSTDWEYGIGTPVLPAPTPPSAPPPSSAQTTVAMSSRPSQSQVQREGIGSGPSHHYASSPIQYYPNQHPHQPHPIHTAHRSNSVASPVYTMSSPNHNAPPAIIAQPSQRGSMLIPALHPGLHRPLPSPVATQRIMPAPLIIGPGPPHQAQQQQTFRLVHASPSTGSTPTSRKPSMSASSPSGLVSTPNTLRSPYGGDTVAKGMERERARVQEDSTGKRRVEPEVVETGVGGARSPDQGEGSDAGGRKKKKPRVALSCAQCTKRKQRCNREIPCQHCTARRVPEHCTPYIPGQPFPHMPKPPKAPKATASKKASTRAQVVIREPIETLSPDPIAQASPAIKSEVMSPIEQDTPERRISAAAPDDEGLAYSPVTGDEFDHDMIDHATEQQGQGEASGREAGAGESQAELLRRISSLEDTVFHARARIQRQSFSSSDRGDRLRSKFGPERSHPGYNARDIEPETTGPSSKPDGADRSLGREAPQPAREMLSRSTSAGEEGFQSQGDVWLKEMEMESKVPTIEGHRRGMSTIKFNLADCGTPSDNLQRLIEDCGVSPQKLEELLRELPEYTHALALVDLFFAYINNVRYAIDETAFRDAFNKIYEMKRVGRGPEASDVRSLPLIFIVLATSVRSAPDDIAGSEKRRKNSSLRLYWCSRRSILIAASINPDSLELVLTRLLSALYLVLVHDRRLTESWSQLGASLRTAQAIGCHRDGTKLGLDAKETENRRRIWAYLYHADRHYSLILGRPPSIIDSYVDSKEPSNVELSEIQSGKPIVSRPLDQPTSATITILRLRFSKITGRITHHFQALDEPATYEAVQQLDNAILTFVDDLPPHYRMVDPDTSLDVEHDYIIMHRYIICTEILFMRIVLHRPWVLLKLRSDKYTPSRKAAFEAARMDSRLRRAFHQAYKKPVGVYFTSQFREFNAAMMAGIGAILAPRGPDAQEMRMILAAFLQRHPLDVSGTMDAASQKEARIIHLLHNRAQLVPEGGESSLPDPSSESVALLLGLRGDAGADHATMQNDIKGDGSSSEQVSNTGPLSTGDDQSGSAASRPMFASGTLQQERASSWPSPYVAAAASGPLQSLNRLETPAQLVQSPSSAKSTEDNEPQMRLNQWWNLNNSMSMTGSGANAGLTGYLGTGATSQNGSFGVFNEYAAFGEPTGWSEQGLPVSDPYIARSGHDISPSADMGDLAGHYGQQDNFHAVPSRLVQAEARTSNVDPTEGLDMEHIDAYWTALIDGICKTQQP